MNSIEWRVCHSLTLGFDIMTRAPWGLFAINLVLVSLRVLFFGY